MSRIAWACGAMLQYDARVFTCHAGINRSTSDSGGSYDYDTALPAEPGVVSVVVARGRHVPFISDVTSRCSQSNWCAAHHRVRLGLWRLDCVTVSVLHCAAFNAPVDAFCTWRRGGEWVAAAGVKQEISANAKGTRDSSACMKAHYEQM